MNGFSIILIISILAEIVIYLRNIRYIKSYLTTNKLEQLYKFYKEIENEKDKRTIFKEETFNTLDFLLENVALRGSINKLGQIDYEQVLLTSDNNILLEKNYDVPALKINWGFPPLTVVNAYTQYQPGKNLDYEALTLCMRKINHIFKGKHIGLPQIGAGIAGGDWNRIKTIIQQELKDCDVTVVIYNK